MKDSEYHKIGKRVHALRRSLPYDFIYEDALTAIFLDVAPSEDRTQFYNDSNSNLLYKFYTNRTAERIHDAPRDRIDLLVALNKAGVTGAVMQNLESFRENVIAKAKAEGTKENRSFAVVASIVGAARGAHPEASMVLASALAYIGVDVGIMVCHTPHAIMSALARYTHETGFRGLNDGLRMALENIERYEQYVPYFDAGVTNIEYIQQCIADDIDAELAASAA